MFARIFPRERNFFVILFLLSLSMGKFSNMVVSDSPLRGEYEKLRVSPSKKNIKLTLRLFLVKEEDFFVTIIPSLGISGYGKSEEDSTKMMIEGLDEFFEFLVNSDKTDIKGELSKSGWFADKYQSKLYKIRAMTKTKFLSEFDLLERNILKEQNLQLA